MVRFPIYFYPRNPLTVTSWRCADRLFDLCAGFNRTGFVVCAYLIQVCRLTVQEALAAFGAARPPGVKHEKFVVELSRWLFVHYAAAFFQLSADMGIALLQ